MAIVDRQNNLFAAEDWKVAYQVSIANNVLYDFNNHVPQWLIMEN